jgi:hypothetical protein
VTAAPQFSADMSAAEREAVLAGVEQPPPPPADHRKQRPTTRAARRARAAEVAAERAAAEQGKPDAAPRPPRATASRAPRAGTTKAHVAKSIEGLHAMSGAVAVMVGKPMTGQLLEATAVDAGKVWAELSDRYPVIGKWLSGGGDAMLFVNLLMIYGPIIMTATAEQRDPNASANLGAMLGTLGGMAAPPAAA